MRYQGSKARLAKYIVPIIEGYLTDNKVYVEPFMGGCNILGLIDTPNKIGNDINSYVVKLWRALQNGWLPPETISADDYDRIKADYTYKTGFYSDALIGYVGTACSYGSAWWNGYAKFNPKKGENHTLEAFHGLQNQLKGFKFFKDCTFTCRSYNDILIPDNAVVYCDPPYANTKSYECDFNNNAFWQWCREIAKKGCKVIISEYDAPSDFTCIMEIPRRDGMGTCKAGCKPNTKIEKLFTI